MLKTFERKTSQLDEQASRAQRELRQQIMDQSKMLRDEFMEKNRELSESFDRAIQKLCLEKTDRAALATLFSEVALRLNNELTISTIE
jgi:Na+-translocating ferredoxin:NAD+ oxidoreductase RnfG subunit